MPAPRSRAFLLWPTLRVRMALLYAGLICTSGIALLGITYLLAPGLLIHRETLRAPHQPPRPTDTTTATHSAGIISWTFLHSDSFKGAVFALTIMVVFSLAAGWLIAGRFVRPLRTIIAAARDISASNLNRRLGVQGSNDEFTELGGTLDDLFGRLEASFESQRHFVANASHELRTPLAGQRTLLQVALADPDADTESLRAACEEALALGDQQERLIEALLTLASSEGGVERWEPFDLAEIAENVISGRQQEADSRGIRIDTTLNRAPAVGDPRLVASLVANLVDNALRHNIVGGHVAISTASSPEYATIAIDNTGPLVSRQDLERLFRPFHQTGTERVRRDGHGLGLAIVLAIADAHGARLAPRPRPEGGLNVEVTFRSTKAA
jgi:signal transduction histidine kinase